MEIVSIFTVTDLSTGKSYEEAIEGDGQEAATAVMRLYPRFSRFILEGFEIGSRFVPLDLNKRY